MLLLASPARLMGLAQWRGGYRLARVMAGSPPSRPYRRHLARGRLVDYLLIAGPGRSGSTYLFEGLAGRGDFVAPAIKEGAYYRAPGRLSRAVARLPADAVLLDGANAAWRDPRLAVVGGLCGRDCRVLLVLLVRGHVDWARSMKAFRASRGDWLGWLGDAALERGVVGSSLSPADVTRLLGLGVDVLCVDFAVLVRDPATVLDRIAELCGRPPGGRSPPETAVNPSVAARNKVVAAAGKHVAVALRAFGWLLLLRRLKASGRLQSMFFRPLDGPPPPLRETHERELLRREAACRAVLEAATVKVAEGLRLKADSLAPGRTGGGARRSPGRRVVGAAVAADAGAHAGGTA